MEEALRAQSIAVRRGGAYAGWDLEIRGGSFGTVRTCMAVEEHGSGTQLIRFRTWPRIALPVLLLTLSFLLLAVAAAVDKAWPATFLLGTVAAFLALRMLADSSAALWALNEVLKNAEPVEKE